VARVCECSQLMLPLWHRGMETIAVPYEFMLLDILHASQPTIAMDRKTRVDISLCSNIGLAKQRENEMCFSWADIMHPSQFASCEWGLDVRQGRVG
jgi:hypothetical protein